MSGRQPHPGYCNRQWHRPDPRCRSGPAIESRVRAHGRRSRGHRSLAISEQPRGRHARRDVHRLGCSGAPAVRGRQLRRGGLAIRTGVCGSRPGVGRGRARARARRNAALAGAQRKQRSRPAESRAGARSRVSARTARTRPLHEYVRSATASPQRHAVLDGDAQRELRAGLRVVQSPSAGESRAGDVQRLRRHRQPLAGLRSWRSGEDAGGVRASADVARRSHPQPPRCGDDAATSPVAAGHPHAAAVAEPVRSTQYASAKARAKSVCTSAPSAARAANASSGSDRPCRSSPSG